MTIFFPDISRTFSKIPDTSLTAVKFPDISGFPQKWSPITMFLIHKQTIIISTTAHNYCVLDETADSGQHKNTDNTSAQTEINQLCDQLQTQLV